MIDRCKFIHNLPCEQVSDRIIELEDENAKLDRRRRSLQADVERLSGIIHRQRKELSTMQYAIECRNDENAKLRRLARGLNWCTENAKVPSAECEYCPLGDAGYGELSCERLMRELRIEEES